MKKLVWFSFLALYAFQCEREYDSYGFTIRNNSTRSISIYVAKAGTQHVYPDTLLPNVKPELLVAEPNVGRYLEAISDTPRLFAGLPTDTLSIFLFDTDTVNSLPWNDVRQNYKILKRYDITRQGFATNGYLLNYP